MKIPGVHNYEYVTKKYMFDLLQEKYHPNEKMIDRLTHSLMTEEDVKNFIQIVVDAFERGYLKAVNDYREQFRKIGYQVNIVADTKPHSKEG